MSRAERRQYERMTKGQERGGLPPVPPGARARMERKRAARRSPEPVHGMGLSLRFWLRSLAIALAVGLVAFSLAWPSGMPFAVYVGLGATVVALAVLLAFRALQRRTVPR